MVTGVISFYGDAKAILGKLEKFDMNLSGRRVFFFTLETKDDAEVSFFERDSPGQYHVYQWKGAPSPNLAKNIDKAIIANKGVACVGEQTKVILKRLPGMKDAGVVPAPVSATAAVRHQIQAKGDAYMRTSAYLMC